MANPARLVVYGNNNQPLKGSVSVFDPDNAELTGSEIHEFSHQVFTIEKDYLYALLYGIDFIRQHKPLVIVKPVDKMSVPLRSLLMKGAFLPKVEVRWYTYREDSATLQEYFRMTMEHVRLHMMSMAIPDVKNPDLERYGHIETISFCYQQITWLYKKGTLLYTDIWNGGFFAEEDEMDFSGKVHVEDMLEEMAPVVGALVVTFTSGVYAIALEDVAFDKKAKVTFTATFSRDANMKERKVYAKLFAVCNGKVEDMYQVQEGRLSEDGSWSTMFTLRKPKELIKKGAPAHGSVEYYAVIENDCATNKYKSDSIKIPGLNKSVVYFVTDENEAIVGEIVDLFNNGAAIQEYTTDSEGKIVVEIDSPEGEYGLLLRSDLSGEKEIPHHE